ncbi:hypothetical protein D3C86_1482170 [compost metagenome]
MTAALAFQIGAADDIHQPLITFGIGGQQNDGGKLLKMAIVVAAILRRILHVDRQLATDDRLQTLIARLFGKLQRNEEVVGVGNGYGRLAVRDGLGHDFLEGQRPLKQGISGMNPKMDETGGLQRFARGLSTHNGIAHIIILSF